MFEYFRRFPWVLDTYRYTAVHEVLRSLDGKVIAPAEGKAKELLGK
ncbi:MAG: hypothetical protein AB7G75_34560 [Candidatus Binatia bacterium]